jgi:outer membrane protein assembly factor BamB
MRKFIITDVALRLAVSIVCLFCIAGAASAVTSKVTYQNTAEELLKGKTENIVIGSKGTLQLGHKWERLTKDFNDVWSINSIVPSGGKIYIGTSPNGGIYRYSLGKVEQVYSALPKRDASDVKQEEKSETNDANEAGKVVEGDEQLANEHIFAMATDISGRLLAGISGRRCALCRLEGNELRTIFEPNDAKYIFAIKVADNGTIFLGTGPQGRIYALNSAGKDAKVVYGSSDKNIMSLAIADDGSLLAGSDTRGLVYKIDPDTGSARVLYDSEQPEVTALLVTQEGDVYAAATSAQVVVAQKQFARQIPLAGRPETEVEEELSGDSAGKSSTQLKIANTSKNNKAEGRPEGPSRKPPKPEMVSHLYKISAEGFVTDVFSEAAVLFALGQQGQQLLLGTGNEAELFTVDPVTEDSAVIYKDEQASQITALTVVGEDIYAGTANPAKLIKLSGGFAEEGTYTSDLVDASQPADWGKLQIEADIPQGCKVTAASRSGNVADINDPTFSQWTEAVEVDGPVQLRCPMGRFCQYKLTLSTADGSGSPVVREVAVASTIPNLAPNVKEVTAERSDKPEKQGLFEIKYTAEDDNGDTLIYKIDFRKLGRQVWIELAKDVEQPSYEWDGRTVEDGRYEIRVTASDERSNSAEAKLTASRVSEPVVVDNTGPAIEIHSVGGKTALAAPVEIRGDKAVIKLAAVDRLSAIEEVAYTIDSDKDWQTAIPDDLVYDTTEEQITIGLEELKAGEHVVSIRAKDSVGNTTYKTVELNVIAK